MYVERGTVGSRHRRQLIVDGPKFTSIRTLDRQISITSRTPYGRLQVRTNDRYYERRDFIFIFPSAAARYPSKHGHFPREISAPSGRRQIRFVIRFQRIVNNRFLYIQKGRVRIVWEDTSTTNISTVESRQTRKSSAHATYWCRGGVGERVRFIRGNVIVRLVFTNFREISEMTRVFVRVRLFPDKFLPSR